jgi:2-polyprenyl-3-methyl-5-hydroxy-6-metoxy-1,4-benzoquinol methylase
MNDNVKLQERFYESRKYTNNVEIDKRMKAILKMMPHGKGKLKLLDIGCSDGKIGKLLLERGYDVYGVDISQKALRKANERGIKTIRADITKGLPYKDAEFDVIFCGEVLEHVLDPLSLLKEIHRILKNSGEFVLTVPNISMLKNAFLILAGSLPCYACIYNGPHVRDYCKKIIIEMLKKTGFKNIKVRGDRISIPYASQKDVSLPPIIPRFCDYLVIKCKK